MEHLTKSAIVLASNQTLRNKHIMLLYDNFSKTKFYYKQAKELVKEIPDWENRVRFRLNCLNIDESTIYFGYSLNSMRGRSLNLVFLDSSYNLEELQGWYGVGFCRFLKRD